MIGNIRSSPPPLSDVALQQVKAGEKKPQYSSDRKYRIRVAYPVYSEHDWKENIGFYVTDGAVPWFQSVQYTTNRIESLTSGLFRKYAKTKRSFPWDCQTPAWGSCKYGKERKKQHSPFWNDSGILNNPGIVPKQRLTDTQIETLPKQAAKEHHRILKICQIQWS